MTALGEIFIQNECGQWLHFSQPHSVFIAHTSCEVAGVLASAEGAINNGHAVAGFLSYEAASGIDSSLETLPASEFPLAWFGSYAAPKVLNALPLPVGTSQKLDWHCSSSLPDYVEALSQIKRYIREGDTYQVNFTVRLHAEHLGDPYALFHQLQVCQQSRNAAYLNIGDYEVCSASPELFFKISGSRITARPMKGTMERGMTLLDDDSNADALRNSAKDCAENVMIVDMIRNDIGRIATAGSVRVSSLFDVEHYPTVSQLTSTVEAESNAPFTEVMRALFPCASITGAPKVRTMQIIKELETEPRNLYTGSIGYWLPERDARFNVAIRTVIVDKQKHVASYGVGGGIVWDSVAEHEYAECQTKAKVLARMPQNFEILETLLWERDGGYFLLDHHIQRALRSAQYFGFALGEVDMQGSLLNAVRDYHGDRCRVRWLLSRSGGMSVEMHPVGEGAPVKRVGLALGACDSKDPFLYHKTTQRAVYEQARLQCPDADDVLLVNERGEVTESTIANIVIEKGGKRVTPPVTSGLLNGTFRQNLVNQNRVSEGVLYPDDIRAADALYLINSVRKWMPVSLMDEA